MSETHDSGPWVWEREGNVLNCGPECNRTSVISIRHDAGFQYLAVSDANRKLIAAAPDLLAALKAVEWVTRDGSEYFLCPCCGAAMGNGHVDGCQLSTAIAKAEKGEVDAPA